MFKAAYNKSEQAARCNGGYVHVAQWTSRHLSIQAGCFSKIRCVRLSVGLSAFCRKVGIVQELQTLLKFLNNTEDSLRFAGSRGSSISEYIMVIDNCDKEALRHGD